MKQLKKREYATPIIERIEARVERGFAVSGETPQNQGMSGSSTESYAQGTGNTGDNGYVFS